MIIDKLAEFSDAQTVTATGASTNHMDLSVAGRDISPDEQLYLHITVEAIDASSGDETYSVALQMDDNSSFSSATSVGSQTIPRTAAVGQKYELPIPTGVTERYVRVYATLGGTTPSLTYNAFITNKRMPVHTAYADAI